MLAKEENVTDMNNFQGQVGRSSSASLAPAATVPSSVFNIICSQPLVPLCINLAVSVRKREDAAFSQLGDPEDSIQFSVSGKYFKAHLPVASSMSISNLGKNGRPTT